MTIYTHSDSNARKTWLLMSFFLLAVIGIGFVFSRVMDSPVILYVAVGFSIISSFVSYWWSDKIVLSMSGAREIDRNSARDLYNLVENLCITAGLPVPKIYIINDISPNAFATGRDPKHAVIAVTTGLLSKLERSELEGVLAHELSHIGNRDILLATVVTVLVGMVVILADLFWRWSFFGGRRKSNKNDKAGAIMLVLAIALMILAPLFAYMMQFAISRKREFKADADGALLTRYPEALAKALEKISSDPSPMSSVNRATAHLYIASPLRGEKGHGFFAKAFMTHPPVGERIAALRGMSGK